MVCLAQPDRDRTLFWSLSGKQQFFLQLVFAYQHQFEDPSALNTDMKMVDLLRNLSFSNNLPGVRKHQTHHMTRRSPFHRDREWAKWDNSAKYFTITITSSKTLLGRGNSTFNLCNLNKSKCISRLFEAKRNLQIEWAQNSTIHNNFNIFNCLICVLIFDCASK